ncbi:modulator of macroautophagy TMEM150B [Perognathus longimembris pacificus]|uniref:modulator of macroautophagy TMEM150B n=1 Tax=Perognathus longimembris pacificus TaxID=214514 RepID=UPI0020194498|nr:modulator of macroautophagy TMEM150B [Perognathus longimembris pacificus]
MRSYLSLLPILLAVWAIAGVWLVFAIAVINRDVDLTINFPFISQCGTFPPQSCIFSQVLNTGAAMVVWICIVRYHQLRDWGVRKWTNQLILCSGILCALGTSIAGNFQEKNQKPTHLAGAFLAFIEGNMYFWLQIVLFWWKGLSQPGAPWMAWLRLGLCSLCSILIVTMLALSSAACEWAVAMLLFFLFGLLAVDFSVLDGCTLCLQPQLSPRLQPQALACLDLSSLTPASPETLQTQLPHAL